jgi:hypothetical protein
VEAARALEPASAAAARLRLQIYSIDSLMKRVLRGWLFLLQRVACVLLAAARATTTPAHEGIRIDRIGALCEAVRAPKCLVIQTL